VHPATRATVDEYVAWYDRHFDPQWQDVLLAPPDAQGTRTPWAYALPKSSQDLRAMGKSFSATTFLSAGNITHTPAYGNLIALGILDAVQQRNVSPEQIANAARHRERIVRTGRFLTFSAGAATIGARMRPDPAERVPLKLVRETDAGLIVRGKVGMHTSPVYAEDVYIGAHCGIERGPHRATFTVPVATPGVTVICRKAAARHPNPFLSPLSSRFDELDGQMWLDDVFIPWERVFLMDVSPEPMASWLFWHQLYCWLSKAEFTLGLALACTHAMGLVEHEPTIEYLIDLVVDVQTVRTCQTAAELDPEITPEGYCIPNRSHVAAGTIAIQKARQRMAEDPSGLVPGRGALGQGSRGSGGRGRTRGVVRGRRLHGAPALGAPAAGVRSRRLGARRPRVGFRASRQRRHPGLARTPATLLQPLQRPG